MLPEKKLSYDGKTVGPVLSVLPGCGAVVEEYHHVSSDVAERSFRVVCEGGISLLLIAPSKEERKIWMEGIDIMLIGGYKRRSAQNDDVSEVAARIPQANIGLKSETSPAKHATAQDDHEVKRRSASPPNRSSVDPMLPMRKARPSSVHVKSPPMKPKEDVHVRSDLGVTRKLEERRQNFEPTQDREKMTKESPKGFNPTTRLSAQQDKENGSHRGEIVPLKPQQAPEISSGHERRQSDARSSTLPTVQAVEERRAEDTIQQWGADAEGSSHDIALRDDMDKAREVSAVTTERPASLRVGNEDTRSGVLRKKESFELRAEVKSEILTNDKEEETMSKMEEKPDLPSQDSENATKPDVPPSVSSQRRSVLDMVGQINQMANSADAANMIRWKHVDSVLKTQGNQIKKTRAEPEFGVALIDASLQAGRFEWEVEFAKTNSIHWCGVGVALPDVKTGRSLRREEARGSAWFYHSKGFLCDGDVLVGDWEKLPPFGAGDKITIRLDADAGTLEFSCNGKWISERLEGVKKNVVPVVYTDGTASLTLAKPPTQL
uniref:B30.2/SPRY domain-containing protein n=2 Tax=Guillardia theta TaxID=55529 RepID=A0A6U5Y0T0_GUITH|mmetsp:Transcript_19713/g.65664  ORF Transcript_19713/g.65664 Transcript_19713/m.65664 type:complete len:549 (+) Transcript_19713:483-2129(+)